ncbi:MAG: DUF6602 domain-containing protein [Chitinophagales bacterium]|jgi:hypothetical protein
MIETVAQFLEEFKSKGLDQIKNEDSDITHPVTIGDIYEGLTSELLERAIFRGLNLRIVQNSFIYNDNDDISKEMDCMIVIGEGKKISFTNRFKYHIKNVIAVVQVKKNIYKDSLDDVHQNLKSVIETAIPRDGEAFMGRLHYDAYKLLLTKEIPKRTDLDSLPWREQMMFHFLQLQVFWPVRILIGYNSYKTEYKLREGFVEHLENLIKDGPVPGYNPISFPDLMICGKNSIIKNVGMPFGFPLNFKNEFYWEILMSSPKNPMYFLLELIWTRISYQFDLGSQIFGDDFSLDAIHPFIRCKERKMDGEKYGWEYAYHWLTPKALSKPLPPIAWLPIEIEFYEQVILMSLFENRQTAIDKELEKFCLKHKTTVEDLIDKWTRERIAYKNGNKIVLLLDEPIMTSDPDGKLYIGENKSGEMINWMNKRSTT